MIHLQLPPDLRDALGNMPLHAVTEGESEARVYRVQKGEQVRYLKMGAVRSQYESLQALADHLPVPRILHYTEDDRAQYLLMSACEGWHPFHDAIDWSVAERISAMVDASQRFHALDTALCDRRLSFADQLAEVDQALAQRRMQAGRWQALHGERSVEAVYDELLALCPTHEDWALVHGDLYPVNIRVDAQTHALIGFIDTGGLAIADRYTDLARIANAIGWHYPSQWIEHFFVQYGQALDADKLRFYQLLLLFT
ncbi:MAG: phosphotransferase [Anaerolineae bacterium]